MRKLKIVLMLPLLLLWYAAALQADTGKYVDVANLAPSHMHREASVIITRVVNSYHLRKIPLDDKLSEVIFKRYLESLDPNRSYFTQRDIEYFSKYKRVIDDALKKAWLAPAFDIFKLYRRRVGERVKYALKMLEVKHDFSVDEDYRFDRSKMPWLAGEKELNETWRKRVKNDILSLRLLGKNDEDINTTLRKRYQSTATRIKQFTADDVFQTFVNAYTLSLEPHSSYMTPEVSENFDISMRLSLEGIGAVLRSKNEYTEIVRTVPGGPAALSGQVKGGDRIVGVGQGDGEIENVLGWRLQDVVEMIRGHKGTVVRLEILPKGASGAGPVKIISLVRNMVKLEDQAAKESVIQGMPGMNGKKIGVIDIPAFYRDFRGQNRGDKNFRSTTRDVNKLIKELKRKQVDGIVIDLRRNGGGSLAEATELTGLFIKTGPVVQVLDSNGHLDVEKDSDPSVAYKGPLAVLVNRESASASEIFAGAIQDYGRGIIIGEPTFGKGTVQTLIELDRMVGRNDDKDLGRLRLTMAQFYRISGSSTQFRGVVPDIRFPNSEADKDYGERSLDNALPWGKIDPVHSISHIKPGTLSKIIDIHNSRIKNNIGFRFLDEEYKIAKKLRDRKTITLNEAKRRADWRDTEKVRRASENRFRKSVDLKLLPEEGEIDLEEEDEAGSKAISKIEVNEAARMLADFINLGQYNERTAFHSAALIDL